MSLQKFISELQQRELLSERQLAKLSEAGVERQMSPKQLAKFLVQKNHLTQKQATDVLNAVLLSGGDLDSATPPIAPVAAFEPDPPELTLAPVYDADDLEDSGDDAGSSSVFAAFLTNPKDKSPKSPPANEDELILLPSIEEEPPGDAKTRRRGVELPNESNQWTKESIADDPQTVSLPEPAAASENVQPLDTVVTPRMTTSLSRSKKKKKDGKKAKTPNKKTKGESKWDSP